jgi:teichuronic acid biosynthesis glycosyltransferase TuaC
MIRTLLFSTLFPSSVRPNHGIFVETRLRQLLTSGQVETRVVAPVPWFPFRHKMFGEYAHHAAIPHHEVRNGISVEHPRFLLLPRVGMNSAPQALARTGLAAAKKLIAEGYNFDLIDAHYFYPDGVAATIIGKALNKPVVITARGTDINLIPQYEKPRRMILQAAEDCTAIITVCEALKNTMVGLGGTAQKITVLRNGVDLELFYPEDRAMARDKFGVTRFALASVGNLIPTKGHQLVMEALRELPDVELMIAGRGPHEKKFMDLAVRLGVADRVKFLGVLSQAELRGLYSAVDVLVLASEREGWPNVLLEAMACGTPVVASAVGGIGEIITQEICGVLMGECNPREIAHAIVSLRKNLPERSLTRAYAEKFSWNSTTDGQIAIFRQAA